MSTVIFYPSKLASAFAALYGWTHPRQSSTLLVWPCHCTAPGKARLSECQACRGSKRLYGA